MNIRQIASAVMAVGLVLVGVTGTVLGYEQIAQHAWELLPPVLGALGVGWLLPQAVQR